VSGFLLDTNVISELIKPKPDTRVVAWVDSTKETLLFLSVLTIGEIRKGIAAHPDAKRRVRLEAWLVNDLTLRFVDRILPIDSSIAERWGRLTAAGEQSGRPLSVIDGLLAATAQHHNLTLVTRNTAHVSSTGVSLFNPWLD
jgi:predicted nucleic acid-binding protein